MGKNKRQTLAVTNNFTPGEVEQFLFMSVRQRLRWLEEANAFINKAIGFKKRALTDTRFIGLPEGKKTQRPKRGFKV